MNSRKIPANSISMMELMQRLKLSRSYITKNITHVVKHTEDLIRKGSVVYFDRTDLGNWLMNHATFTRQTIRMNPGRLSSALRQKLRQEKAFPLTAMNRGKVPAVPVTPFDFLDLRLFFPKAYTKDDKYESLDHVRSAMSSLSVSEDATESSLLNPSICYRDMFTAGAIKIQLGSQKTMFYVPNLPDSISLRSYNDELQYHPDWLIPMNAIAAPEKRKTPEKPYITCKLAIECDSTDFDGAAIEAALARGFQIEKVTNRLVNKDAGKTTLCFDVRMPKTTPVRFTVKPDPPIDPFSSYDEDDLPF